MSAPRFSLGTITSTFLNALAQYIDDTRPGVLARGLRTSNGTTTTTEIGILRVDGVPIKAGHLIRISTGTLHLFSTIAQDIVSADLKYTTDGSSATTSSTLLRNAQDRAEAGNTDQGASPIAAGTYTPTADETLSVLLTARKVAGSGSITLLGPIEVIIEDLGVDPGDTGIDI